MTAWIEGENGDLAIGAGAYSGVRVQRVSMAGEPKGEAVLIAPMAADVDQIEPSFVPWSDAVALSWARGTHLYDCGGCIPDHTINLVLIDPDTLSPRSNVVQVAPTEGGLLNRSQRCRARPICSRQRGSSSTTTPILVSRRSTASANKAPGILLDHRVSPRDAASSRLDRRPSRGRVLAQCGAEPATPLGRAQIRSSVVKSAAK